MLAKLDANSGSRLAVASIRRVDSRLGGASLGILSQSPQPAALRDGELLAILDGELYDMESLRAGLRGRGHEIAADDFAAALLATYADGGVAAHCRARRVVRRRRRRRREMRR